METLSAEAIVVRIQSQLANAQRDARDADGAPASFAVAFDGDGTLWRGDVGEDFFRAVVAAGRFLPPAIAAMRDVGRAAGVDGMDEPEAALASLAAANGSSHNAGVAVAGRVFQGYLDHKVPEDVICEVIAVACAGWREDEVTALARDVVVRGGLEARRHLELGVVLDWARASNVEAYLVSASPRPVVEAAGQSWGFDREHVIATTAPFDNGVLLAHAIRPIPYGTGKATLLRERLGDRVLLAAFGDNIFDVPMLEGARVAVVVDPKARLVAHLAEREGKPAGFAGFWEGREPVRVELGRS